MKSNGCPFLGPLLSITFFPLSLIFGKGPSLYLSVVFGPSSGISPSYWMFIVGLFCTRSWEPARDLPPWDSLPRGTQSDPYEPIDPSESWSTNLKGRSFGMTVLVLVSSTLRPLDLPLAFLLGLLFDDSLACLFWACKFGTDGSRVPSTSSTLI